jgi:integrase
MAVANTASNGDSNPLAAIFEHYLRHLEKHASEKTFKEYRKVFRDFLETWPDLLVKEVKPFHLEQWWEGKHANWSEGTRLYGATAIRSALNWASGAQAGIIPANPLKGMVMPKGRSRGAETLVSWADHDKLIEVVPEDLRDVLEALRHTGTRPSMVSKVTAAQFYADAGIWRIDEHKTSKKTGKPLVVPLSSVVVDICKRLAKKYPEGPLFRTKKGEPWNPTKLASRILWYKKKIGVDVIAYGYRHTVATELLEAGVPDAQVAAILGHGNTAMIYRHYSHLGSKMTQLRGVMETHVKRPT